MPHVFSDSPGKRTVRKVWNTPFLRYLHSEYGIKYRYMGLPGSKLVDVNLWADMIDEVVAFEVKDNSFDGRESIRELRRNLALIRKQSLAYYGSFEEVVILGQDWDGQEYKQNKLVTLYNLDFCDEISSKIDTKNLGEKVWRYAAIRQILIDQKECYQIASCPCFFIILLTVRNQIYSEKIRELLQDTLYHDTQRYSGICQATYPIPSNQNLVGTHAWALKAFIHSILRSYFSTPNICSFFFPLVKYEGTRIRLMRNRYLESPMLNLMVFCKFDRPERTNPRCYPLSYLEDVCSLRASNTGTLSLEPEPGELNNPLQGSSSVTLFQQYENLFFTERTQELKSLSA